MSSFQNHVSIDSVTDLSFFFLLEWILNMCCLNKKYFLNRKKQFSNLQWKIDALLFLWRCRCLLYWLILLLLFLQILQIKFIVNKLLYTFYSQFAISHLKHLTLIIYSLIIAYAKRVTASVTIYYVVWKKQSHVAVSRTFYTFSVILHE